MHPTKGCWRVGEDLTYPTQKPDSMLHKFSASAKFNNMIGSHL